MKNIKNSFKVFLITTLVVISFSCEDNYEVFIEPKAEFTINKTEFEPFEPVLIENLGSGENFVFWPGDESQNFALKEISRNVGLPPNRGKDFEYFYQRSGTYTMVVVASSFDETEDKLVRSIDSVTITVKTGNNGNNFTNFSISSAYPGYSPDGIISNDSILIPIGYINRANGISDTTFVEIINSRPPLFSVNSSSAEVYSEEGELLADAVLASYDLNLFNESDLQPIVRKFKVIQDGAERVYSVQAMFYPELLNFSVLGINAIKYSTDGINYPTEDYVIQQQLVNLDKSFFSLLYSGKADDLKSVVPTFSTSEGSKVFLRDTNQELISGVTPIDCSTGKVELDVSRTLNGFTIIYEVDINVVIF